MPITILIKFDDPGEYRAIKVIEQLRDHFFGLHLNVVRNGFLFTGDQYLDQYYGRGDQL